MNTECIGQITTQNFWSSSRRRLPVCVQKGVIECSRPISKKAGTVSSWQAEGRWSGDTWITLLRSSLVLLSSFPLQEAANISVLLSCHHSNLVCEIILKFHDRLLIQGQKMTFRFYFKAVSSTSQNWDVDLNACDELGMYF